MTKQTQSASVAPAIMFEVRCRVCRWTVSKPVHHLGPEVMLGNKVQQPVVPAGGFVLVDRAMALVNRHGFEHGIVMNAEDIQGIEPDKSSYGCCGYTTMNGPNLRCPKGHPLGTLSDDCLDPFFVHLSLELCELYPLPPA